MGYCSVDEINNVCWLKAMLTCSSKINMKMKSKSCSNLLSLLFENQKMQHDPSIGACKRSKSARMCGLLKELDFNTKYGLWLTICIFEGFNKSFTLSLFFNIIHSSHAYVSTIGLPVAISPLSIGKLPVARVKLFRQQHWKYSFQPYSGTMLVQVELDLWVFIDSMVSMV